MAIEGDTPTDMNAHSKSYSLFSAIMKYGAIISFITAMVIVLIIAN